MLVLRVIVSFKYLFFKAAIFVWWHIARFLGFLLPGQLIQMEYLIVHMQPNLLQFQNKRQMQ